LEMNPRARRFRLAPFTLPALSAFASGAAAEEGDVEFGLVVIPHLHAGITARYNYYFANAYATDNVLTVLASLSFLF